MTKDNESKLRLDFGKQTYVPIESIIPNPKNPRIALVPGMPLYDKLRDSIDHFGYIDPIIWNKRTGMIISGHQRFQVMKDIANENNEIIKEVPVIAVDMSEEDQNILTISLNKITGLWDNEKLAALFNELEEDVQKYTGFDDFEIATLLGNDEPLEYDDGDMSDYEDNADGQLKAYNVILSCKNDEEQEFVKTLIRESGKLRRSYKVADLIDRFNADGEQGE